MQMSFYGFLQKSVKWYKKIQNFLLNWSCSCFI